MLRMHRRLALWLLFLSTLVCLAIALFDYFWTGNGIHGTAGALLVIVSSALMLLASGAFLVWTIRVPWLRALLLFLIVLDLIGTGFAAYMLEAYALLGADAAGLLFWLLHFVIDRAPVRPDLAPAQ